MSTLLKDYEIETLAKIRDASSDMKRLSDDVLCAAYRSWSNQGYCAGWINPSNAHVSEFIKWAITPPIEDFKT